MSRKLRHPGLWLALGLLVCAGPPPTQAQTRAVSRVADRLACQCGCLFTVSMCNMANCGFKKPMVNDIEKRLEAGETPDAIVASFVAQYGELVLSAPTAEGFNLIAWIMPFAMILFAGAGIGLILKRWVRTHHQTSDAVPLSEGSTTDRYRARIHKELGDLDIDG